MGGCDNVVRHVWLTEDGARKGMVFLVAREEGGVNRCEMVGMRVFFEVFHLSAAGGEI